MKTEKAECGIINLEGGYIFCWVLYGDEIHGSLQSPKGPFINGASGWYKTSNPNVAADLAKNYISKLKGDQNV